MSYVVLYADLSELSAAEADAFADAAAGLGLDVDQLFPRMTVDPEVTVLVSTALAALFGKLAEISGEGAGAKLWDLLQRLFRGRRGDHAIEDRQQRITFLWDERAKQDGPIAADAMVAVGDAISDIQDGTALAWDPGTLRWCPVAPMRNSR